MITGIHEPAPAKINLTLRIRGRRGDGLHELNSLVAFAGPGDVVRAAQAGALSLKVEGPFAALLPAGDNLVTRAAQAFFRTTGIPAQVRLMLEKNLPVASGMGGGSADAAATLRLLARLFRVDMDADRLHGLACLLGADVPVCLAGRPAFISGAGQQVKWLKSFPATPVVLVNPGRAVATADVFRIFDGEAMPVTAGDIRDALVFRDVHALAGWCRGEDNDLTAAACRVAPEIGGLLDRLARAPGCLLARMSGSGPTCFGLFAGDAEARATARRIERETGWWARASRLGAA